MSQHHIGILQAIQSFDRFCLGTCIGEKVMGRAGERERLIGRQRWWLFCSRGPGRFSCTTILLTGILFYFSIFVFFFGRGGQLGQADPCMAGEGCEYLIFPTQRRIPTWASLFSPEVTSCFRLCARDGTGDSMNSTAGKVGGWCSSGWDNAIGIMCLTT
ncbi:hypothetical protein F4775DRAFT_211848 [Biscogniauxia sp. FL1348]|nr:hypothetical protein F4775DRAFT_211848 [Biscogniauxia sp. FL1348]